MGNGTPCPDDTIIDGGVGANHTAGTNLGLPAQHAAGLDNTIGGDSDFGLDGDQGRIGDGDAIAQQAVAGAVVEQCFGRRQLTTIIDAPGITKIAGGNGAHGTYAQLIDGHGNQIGEVVFIANAIGLDAGQGVAEPLPADDHDATIGFTDEALGIIAVFGFDNRHYLSAGVTDDSAIVVGGGHVKAEQPEGGMVGLFVGDDAGHGIGLEQGGITKQHDYVTVCSGNRRQRLEQGVGSATTFVLGDVVVVGATGRLDGSVGVGCDNDADLPGL